MIVNEVPSFPFDFFSKTFCLKFPPTHFEHVLHVHTKSFFFDKDQTFKYPLNSSFQKIYYINALWSYDVMLRIFQIECPLNMSRGT